MDKLTSIIIAYSVPGWILRKKMSGSSPNGAAALTNALSGIGPGGMMEGINNLLAIGLISEWLAEFLIRVFYKKTVKDLYKGGETKESMQERINKWHVSKSLKRELKEELDEL